MPYSLELDTRNPLRFLNVHFNCAKVNFNEGKWNIKDAAHILPLHPAQELKDAYPVEELFHKLVESWNAKLPGYEFATQTLLRQLLIAIFQNIRKQSRNYASSFKVEKIIRYMHDNINGKITLAALSGLVQITPATRALMLLPKDNGERFSVPTSIYS